MTRVTGVSHSCRTLALVTASRRAWILLQLLAAAGSTPALAERPDVIWSVATGGTVYGIAFAPDGQTIATAAGGPADDIKLWRIADGTLLRTFKGQDPAVRGVAFSADGQRVASAEYYKVNIWRLEGPLERTIRETNVVRSVAFSPDTTLLASANGGEANLWRVADGTLYRHLRHSNYWYVTSVAFSPAGDLLASASEDTQIRLWQLPGGALLRTMRHIWAVYCVCFSPDGQLLASASDDYTVGIWRVADGTLLRTLAGYTQTVWSVDFSPDGLLVISASSGSPDIADIRIWRVADGTLRKIYDEQLSPGLQHVQFSPDGRFFAFSQSRDVFLARNPLHRARLGDANCDGAVDFGDINPFALALQGKGPYYQGYPDCNWLNGDCNQDGNVDFADINPFVELLSKE